MDDDRTRVYITVDVECAEERVRAGRAAPPMGYDVRVWGRLVNQRDPLGIELIMRELEAYGHRGTFFVEAIGAHYFGKPGLAEVCQALHGRGHDVQLHIHPSQRRADWHSRGIQPDADDMHEYSEDDQAALLCEGRDLLIEAGVPAGELLGYRAGNFGASNVVWRAMRRAGLTLSSNYNPCYLEKNCKMRIPSAGLGLFPTGEEGVWELPITNFIEPTGAFRHLQITAVSLEEMTHCLLRCRALGIPEVTIVTHSFELFFVDSAEARRGHLNRVNVDRLRGLSRFLQERSGEFEVDTVGALARRLREGAGAGAPHRQDAATFPRSTPLHHARRVVEQALKRVAQRVSFD
jgi:hypothetical protein